MRSYLPITFSLLALLTGCTASENFCNFRSSECELSNVSSLLQYTTDNRLMVGVKKLGKIGNGMVVHTWFWNEEAKKLGTRYRDPEFGGVIDNSSFTAVGFLTSEIKKVYPEAVFIRPDGFEQINEQELMRKDDFIRNLIEARQVDGASSCTRVVGTKFNLCF